MYQQPQQQYCYEQPQPIYAEQKQSVKGYAIAALCFLLFGFLLHFLGTAALFFPLIGAFVGIAMGCVGILADVTGLIFLLVCIAKA